MSQVSVWESRQKHARVLTCIMAWSALGSDRILANMGLLARPPGGMPGMPMAGGGTTGGRANVSASRTAASTAALVANNLGQASAEASIW